MTALNEYQRLEARGLWRDDPDAQRREVIVSMGDATLILTDTNDRPLAHWSLPAVTRLNPDITPALYSPDGLTDEVLELGDDASEMIDAIERVRRAIEGRRPHPGRLRLGLIGAALVGVILLAVLWLPGALERHALGVVPKVKRDAIGQSLFTRLQRVTGPACNDPDGLAALTRLARRLPGASGAPRLYVVRDGVQTATHLPGGIILLNRSVVEDTTDPDVVAGYIIAEDERARLHDPLGQLLRSAGVVATVRLLTTGALPEGALDSYAKTLLTLPQGDIPDPTLLAAFRDQGIRSTPYAYALDISGESVLGLIEADPFAGETPDPVLRDADWLRLQAICGG
ncbi:MAG: hypothetical protein ACRBBU_12270 [Pseudooceanicola sp.]